MGWESEADSCGECGFAWSMSIEKAIDVVRNCPESYESALGAGDPRSGLPGRWSPLEYLWHLVDVLRIGRERLWTLALDAQNGVPTWDENELAAARHYNELSPVVGRRALRAAVADWVSQASVTPIDVESVHSEAGVITPRDVIRRNAHEVQHHLLDISRGVRSS